MARYAQKCEAFLAPLTRFHPRWINSPYVRAIEVNLMYAFGVDIPLIELLIAIGIINVILLIEITVVLILLLRKMKSK
jgi:hypothetical protein